MHVLLPDTPPDASSEVTVPDAADGDTAVSGCSVIGSSRVGFVVSKAVGGSVVRHRVARRLRHLMRDRLTEAPAGSRIVVRALPASASADSASLGVDLDRALRGALSGRRSGRSGSPGSDRRGSDRRGSKPPAARSGSSAARTVSSADRSTPPSDPAASARSASPAALSPDLPARHVSTPDQPAASSRS